ncbi:MAG: L-threonylcarbamoyladenylate synthase [Candidatus Staskawiczbacteria bacterium]|jgi:L-threonylcarbamoyladenylate synthase
MKIVKIQKNPINEAVEFLNNGGVVICPTDTVYGFLADAGNRKAIEKIFKIKKRPKNKPLAIFVKDLKMAKGLAQIDAKQEKILKSKWPGKFTFVLPTGNGTIALRIPKYKFLNDLLKKINKPLVQTSVNISGRPALTKIKDIVKVFETQKNQPDLIIDGGNLPKTNPSTIIDLSGAKIKKIR